MSNNILKFPKRYKAIKPYVLPEPHNSIFNAALNSLIESKTDCSIKIIKTHNENSYPSISIEVDRQH